jgi:hypothetical protein
MNKIHEYTMSLIDLSDYGHAEPSATKLLDIFHEYRVRQTRSAGTMAAFNYWCFGLPGCFSIDFENHKLEDVMLKLTGLDYSAVESDVMYRAYTDMLWLALNELAANEAYQKDPANMANPPGFKTTYGNDDHVWVAAFGEVTRVPVDKSLDTVRERHHAALVTAMGTHHENAVLKLDVSTMHWGMLNDGGTGREGSVYVWTFPTVVSTHSV